MSSRMLRSEIRSEIFDLPVPSRHGKEIRKKLERDYSLRACTVLPVPEMHLLRPRAIALPGVPPCMQAKRYWRQ